MNQNIANLKLICRQFDVMEKTNRELAKIHARYTADRAIFTAQANAYQNAKAIIIRYFPEAVDL